MIASIVIIAISVVLFVYWFRYACLLILSAKTARDYSAHVANANQLNFLHVRDKLQQPETSKLDEVHASLDRDYRLLTYLLRHAVDFHPGEQPIEQWMLRLDYHIMGLGYFIVRGFSGSLARGALLERASIVRHLANTIGERVALSSRA